MLLSRLAIDLRETALLEVAGTIGLGNEMTADTLQFAGVDSSESFERSLQGPEDFDAHIVDEDSADDHGDA